MKTGFKVGYRVAVYNGGIRHVGRVTQDLSDGSIMVDIGQGAFPVHPKQCRRLVKKPRRRIWVCEDVVAELGDSVTDSVKGWELFSEKSPFAKKPDYVEFVEVRRKKG